MKAFKQISASLLALSSLLTLSACDLEMPALVNASFGSARTGFAATSAASLRLPPRRLSSDQSAKLARSQAGRFGVEPALVLGVMTQESGFNAHAVSHAGAMGLMQLMPETAKHISEVSPVRVKSAFNPEQNVAAGTWYLKHLANQFKDLPETRRWEFALASYNGGIGRVSHAIQSVSKKQGKARSQVSWSDIRPLLPKETQHYVPAVLSHTAYYRQHLN